MMGLFPVAPAYQQGRQPDQHQSPDQDRRPQQSVTPPLFSHTSPPFPSVLEKGSIFAANFISHWQFGAHFTSH